MVDPLFTNHHILTLSSLSSSPPHPPTPGPLDHLLATTLSAYLWSNISESKNTPLLSRRNSLLYRIKCQSKYPSNTVQKRPRSKRACIVVKLVVWSIFTTCSPPPPAKSRQEREEKGTAVDVLSGMFAAPSFPSPFCFLPYSVYISNSNLDIHPCLVWFEANHLA